MSFAEVVNNLEYGIEFGVLGGLAKTKGIDIGEICNFTLIERKALFHPKHSKRIRRLCLETIVNGIGTENQSNIARDLADCTSMVRQIASNQWDNVEVRAMLINNLESAFAGRSNVGREYFDLALEMFSDKELYVCLTNSHTFVDFLNTTRNNVEDLCHAIDNNYEKLSRVGYFCIDDKINPATDWIIRSVGYLAVCILTGDKARPYQIKNNIQHLRRICKERTFPKVTDQDRVLDTLSKLEREFRERCPGEYNV